MHIQVKKGLDIPIEGKPKGNIQELIPSGSASVQRPKQLALNLEPFEGVRFKLLKKQGDSVKIGEPIVEDKATEGRLFVSPAAGVIAEVRRGLKRRLIDIVIDVADDEEYYARNPLDIDTSSREEVTKALLSGGLFAQIRVRPFNRLADPNTAPRSIFVKAIESAPFTPSAEMQVEGHEEDFQAGLKALSKLTDGSVHLVYRKDSSCSAFTQANNVEKHTAEGPHPVANHSVHIQHIDPIQDHEAVIWTLSALDVIAIGHLLNTGKTLTEKVISIAGPGIIEGRAGFFRVRNGHPVKELISNRTKPGSNRFISGDPLTGTKVDGEEFIGFNHTVFSVIPESTEREMLHFFRLGLNKYSFSKAYYSGHLKPGIRDFFFNTSLHGEERPFIDGSLYDKVMPLNVPTMTLVKAVMAEDYDLAEELGLLEVDSEDFALPTFVCPSKMEMTDIIKDGLNVYASELVE